MNAFRTIRWVLVLPAAIGVSLLMSAIIGIFAGYFPVLLMDLLNHLCGPKAKNRHQYRAGNPDCYNDMLYIHWQYDFWQAIVGFGCLLDTDGYRDGNSMRCCS
jgi:hypothetical protein